VSTLFYVDTSFTTDGQRVSPWFIDRLLFKHRKTRYNPLQGIGQKYGPVFYPVWLG